MKLEYRERGKEQRAKRQEAVMVLDFFFFFWFKDVFTLFYLLIILNWISAWFKAGIRLNRPILDWIGQYRPELVDMAWIGWFHLADAIRPESERIGPSWHRVGTNLGKKKKKKSTDAQAVASPIAPCVGCRCGTPVAVSVLS